MKRVQWERAQKKTHDQKKQEEEAERNAMAAIDWHDFVVVQTIDWEDEEDLPEPEPEAAPEQKKIEIDGGDTEDVEMDMDEDDAPEPTPTNLKVRTGFDVRSRPGMPPS